MMKLTDVIEVDESKNGGLRRSRDEAEGGNASEAVPHSGSQGGPDMLPKENLRESPMAS